MDIECPYTAYCLDEACHYIATRIDKGDEPTFRHKYKSFSDLYKSYT